MADDKDIGALVEEVLGKAGLSLLEFGISRRGANLTAKAVVYSPSGTGTDECAKASRLILSQIQVVLGVQNPSIEVSSPGIDRIFRSDKDWRAFAGKGVKVLLVGEDEWRRGRLLSADDRSVVLEGPKGAETIERRSIAKARLDATYKGE